MARVIVALVLVGLLVAGLFVARDKEPAMAVQDIEAPAGSESLSEIDALASERTAILTTCVEPEEELTVEQIQAKLDEFIAQAVPVLESSADAEHLVVAALFIWRKEPERASRLLNEASRRRPGDPLIATQQLELCELFGGHCALPKVELERRLIAVDKSNGIAWMLVARSRLGRSDEAGALDALRNAASAASLEDNFAEHVLLFDRALAASAGLTSYQTLEDAFGFAAAMVSSSYMITADCHERGGSSAEWQDVCLRLGERLEHDSRTFMGKSIGLSMQASMYELAGDTRSQEQVVDRHEEKRREFHDLIPDTQQAMDLRDARAVRNYLELLIASDEVTAMAYLASEAERLLAEIDVVQQPTCPDP